MVCRPIGLHSGNPFRGRFAERLMPTDGAFWRELRKDFESLQGQEFSIIWESSPLLSFAGEPLDSCWSWFRFPDDSLRARLSAVALKPAEPRGCATWTGQCAPFF